MFALRSELVLMWPMHSCVCTHDLFIRVITTAVLIFTAGLNPRGVRSLLSISHLVALFSEAFSSGIKINNTHFSVLNLRSTTYSKKLIVAIVLHTLPAFCSYKRINHVTK